MILDIAVVFIAIIILCWVATGTGISKGSDTGTGSSRSDERRSGAADVIKNYQNKPTFYKNVIISIEAYDGINDLIGLLESILSQTIKVSLVVLIDSKQEQQHLKKIPIIKDMCIFNKVGGTSLLFKQSNKDTIILFLFGNFIKFSDPQFLDLFLNDPSYVAEDIIKIDCNEYNIPIQTVYTS